jgi:hypothetical protein
VAAGSASELPWAGLPGQEEAREPFTAGLPAEVVFGFYRDQCEYANAIVAATPLSAMPHGRHPGDPAGEICDLRRIVLHTAAADGSAGLPPGGHRRWQHGALLCVPLPTVPAAVRAAGAPGVDVAGQGLEDAG